jgi:O-antigen biosynthesis protein
MTEAPQRLIDWTGERCVPWTDELQGMYEHLHRYSFAAAFVQDRRVLELASGEGYGAALLAKRAQHVLAVDIDAGSVAHSRATYEAPNLEFAEGSMLDLGSLADGAFDVVVCFEALEHVNGEEQAQALAESARVLRAEGVLLLSTPDRETYNAQIHEPNPFHVRELNRPELLELLQPHFPHVSVWAQSGVGGSRLALVEGGVPPAGTREELMTRRDGEWISLPDAPPVYLVVAASRRPLPAPVPNSYLLDPTVEALRERDRRVAARDARIRELKDENAALHRQLEKLGRTRPSVRVRSILARLGGGSR